MSQCFQGASDDAQQALPNSKLQKFGACPAMSNAEWLPSRRSPMCSRTCNSLLLIQNVRAAAHVVNVPWTLAHKSEYICISPMCTSAVHTMASCHSMLTCRRWNANAMHTQATSMSAPAVAVQKGSAAQSASAPRLRTGRLAGLAGGTVDNIT